MEPQHRFGTIPTTCSVCGETFLAKSKLTRTCYEQACAVEARRRQTKARQARRTRAA